MTALQQAIATLKSRYASLKNGLDNNPSTPYSDGVIIQTCMTVIQDDINTLQSLLPADRKQIEDRRCL